MRAIIHRRSIRKYTHQPVLWEEVEMLLRAAMVAPSAGNGQPWHFVVIEDQAMLQEITTFHPFAEMLKEAPLAIAVCANLEGIKYEGKYMEQDCAAATQNILIAATEMGLGTVWLGVHPTPERVKGVKTLLGLPENIVPFSLVAVGYAAEEKPPADRFDRARIHRNYW